MKVTDILKNSEKKFASFELVPPLKGSDRSKLQQNLARLLELQPPFVNFTCHRDEVQFVDNQDGSFKKITVSKRPSSLAIAAAVFQKFDIELVPHVICGGASKQKIENDLMDFSFLGIENVMALRGDAMIGQKNFVSETDGYSNAYQLVSHIADMNNGKYLDADLHQTVKTDFCIGVGAYPEKHRESPNLETDILRLKQKVDAGANYIVTQMFFDNQKFYNFVSMCRKSGISVPIIAGLKPISTLNQIHKLPQAFSIDIPQELVFEAQKCKSDKAVYELGIEWCATQSRDLLASGFNAIHYYTMGRAENIIEIIKKSF
ncbi:MAG: methylenetetrahydrofolate reductase [Prevotellaceae bacterium]|jgi:methylenetetrahydrofolate reductase (NADPH)|nr:methylenetetrahydrofolate reductase [Prevotellaceae bacterium]